MPSPVALAWDLLAKDSASPAFLRAAGSADKLATAAERATKGVEATSARMSAAGAKLTKGFTLPLLGIGAVAVDQAAKFQTSMNTIRVATDQSVASIAQGSKGLESIAKSTGTSLSQLSDSLYTATKAGQPMAQALDTVKAAAQGAKAEHVDLSVATQALTSIMASYGKSLGNPVAAENELIKGAGLAKTTYQDFASSLSNVVPIAASLHISFAQVAGAIDTMTQHGETAQQSTDNLSNLITNLAGSNNVASKALGQLGVNSVDLSKKLASPNGLSGALDTVLAAVDAHGKDGMIVTSAFKQAQLATQSLQTELGSMTGSLKTNSIAFANGTEGYKSYLKYAKSLGGQQYEMAKNFITTMTASKGFNTALASGNGTVKTLAGTLKTALGGVTGMRTALMLSGSSAKTFADSTAAIGKAAHETTGDVLGWSATQDTLAVKVDKAKESLQVLAVEIGTALIPVVTKIVDGVTSAVHWFGSLSDGWKKTIEVSVLVLAALGPVLSIIGNLTKAFGLLVKGAALVWTGLGKLAGVFTTTAVASDTATAQIVADQALQTAAISDAAAKDALAEASKAEAAANASVEMAAAAEASGSSLAGIAAAGAEAAIELSASYAEIARAAQATALAQATAAEEAAAVVTAADATIVADAEATGTASSVALGPIGIAIGAVVGVGALAAHALGLFGGAAKTAIKPEQDLTAAILANNGALGTNVQKIVASKLANAGAYDQALKLGIPIKTLTDAAMGNVSAMKQVTLATAGYAAVAGKPIMTDTAAGRALAAKVQAYDGLNKTLGDLQGTIRASEHVAKQEAEAQSTAGLNATAHAKALKALAVIQKTASDATSGLNRNVGAYGTSIKANTGFLTGALKKYQDLAAAQVLSGTEVNQATLNYNTNTASLYKQATAAGINSTAVEKLIGKYALTPKQIVTNMLLNINKATASAGQLQKTIDDIKQGYIPGLSANSKQGMAVIHAFQSRINALRGKSVPVDVNVYGMSQLLALQNTLNNVSGGRTFGVSINNLQRGSTGMTVHRAAGGSIGDGPSGTVHGTGSPNVDSVMAMLAPGEEVIRASQAGKHRALLKAINAGTDGFAAGGTIPGYAAGGTAASVALATVLREIAASLRTPAESSATDARAYGPLQSRAVAEQAAANKALATYNRLVGDGAKAAAAKAKAAYNTIKQAAADAASAAKTSAAALLASVQSDAAALTTTITGFQSSIKSDLAQGTDLASVWGTVTSLAATDASNLSTAQTNLAAAQQAVTDAFNAASSSMSAYSSAQASVTDATSGYTQAHASLLAAQQAVGGGKGTPEQYAALTRAQQAQTDAVAALSAANSRLAAAQSSSVATGPTVDQIKAVTDAQNALAAAQQASAASGTANAAALQAQFNTILTSTQGFATDLGALAKAGAGQDLISQVAAMGTTAGDALAQQLLAAGPTGIAALQTTMSSIQKIAGNSATQLSASFFGAGVSAMDQFVAGLTKQFPALSAALGPIIAAVNALVAAPAGTVTKAAGTVPKFAAGVSNFAGGLAYVHAGETLVNLSPGTSVNTASATSQMFDSRAIVAEIRALRSDLSNLDERIGDVQLSVIDSYGRAHAKQQLVAARGRSPF